jgi:hydroxyethylthiazole kinase
MLRNFLENVRKNSPLIHCITNYVTVNDVANVLLACGASPIMSDDAAEVEEITSICGGLNMNIGTLNKDTIASMFLAGKKAKELGHKILLDPVGAGASRLRTETAARLMEEIRFDVIRGNVSEIKTLAHGSGNTKGVDADMAEEITGQTLDQAVIFVKELSRRTGSVIVITGAMNLVSDSRKCYVIRNGRSEMSKITGTGCQLSALITAFITANPEHILEASAAAVGMMGLAGEIGWSRMQPGEGNASYRTRIINAIDQMDEELLRKGANYEMR